MLIPTIFQQVPYCLPRKGILHIGAHKCEEEGLYHSIGMGDKDILWIEANPELIQASRPNMIQAVISDQDDQEVEFKITNNGESSSILNMKTHLIEHPHIHEVKRISLKTTTLNKLYKDYQVPFDRYDFINLDIQGAELLALKGATMVLPYVRAIYTEVNEKELYENCGLIHDLDAYLQKYGFKRILTSMTEHGWGDALYVK
jgi:FkbM family methyltransferase